MRVIFATENAGKLREARQIFKDMDVEILPLSAFGLASNPDENAETFEQNALIKIRAAREALKEAGSNPAEYIIMADDSGLEIDAFDGGPGVKSARWMGHDTPYDIKNAKILKLLNGKTEEERGARYVCAIAVALPSGEEFTKIGIMEGKIAEEPAGEGGFGYDPIFLVKEYGKTAAQLLPEEKNAVSHRGKAIAAAGEEIKKEIPAACLKGSRVTRL